MYTLIMLKDTINQTIRNCLQILLAKTRYGKKCVWYVITFIHNKQRKNKTLCSIVAFSFCVTLVLNFESGMLILSRICSVCGLMGWGIFWWCLYYAFIWFLNNSVIIFHEKIVLEIKKNIQRNRNYDNYVFVN